MRRSLVLTVTTLFALGLVGCGDSSSGDPPTGSTCPALGAPIEHSGWITADETWSGDRPHLITSGFTVSKGVTLTIEPCAEVRVKKGVYFYVEGQLLARGEATRRIRFLRDLDVERFASLWIKAPGSASLAYLDLEGGGASTSFGAAVVVEGASFPPDRPLLVEHVTVKHSAGIGIYLSKWAGFASGSTDLAVQSSGEEDSGNPFPVRMSLNAANTLPEGSYTGNARDEIQLIGESPHYNLEIDDAIHDRGVPYQVGGGGAFGIIGVQGTGKPTLTVDPGVMIKFFSSSSNVGGLEVGSTSTGVLGQLVAVGTAAAPIRFTGAGASSSPGSWEGITFVGAIAAGNRLEHVQIDGAGAHGGDTGFGCPPPSTAAMATDGAVKIFTEPVAPFIKSSTISNSSSHGIYRAWKGADIDFLGDNTFQNIAGCNEVLPAPPTGSCPTNPPCPK